MFSKFKNFLRELFASKNNVELETEEYPSEEDLKFEHVSDTIKEIMVANNIRMINISNFNNWFNSMKINEVSNYTPEIFIHSIRLNANGDVELHDYRKDGSDSRAGKVFPEVTEEMWMRAYGCFYEILNLQEIIPNAIKRNIIVKMTR